MPYSSLYKAKVVTVKANAVEAHVPQVFGETLVTVSDFLGAKPEAPTMGWVFFQAGNPEFPVWSSGLSIGTGGGGGVAPDEVWIGPDEPAEGIELWYDTAATEPEPEPGGGGSGDTWNTAWGVVAKGAMKPPPVTTTASSGSAITEVLSFKPLTGRRYLLRCTARAITTPAVAGAYLTVFIDSVQRADVHVSAPGGGYYTHARLEYLFDGDDVIHNYYLMLVGAASWTVHTDHLTSHFVIEDVGPVERRDPVENPTPAWLPLSFVNGWSSLAGWGPCGIRKVGDVVSLRGIMSKTGAGTTDQTAVPPSGRIPPTVSLAFGPFSFNVGAAGNKAERISISPDGTFGVQQAAANGAWIELNSINFSVTP